MRHASQDIQKRTFDFGARVTRLADRMPQTLSSEVYARQLIRSGLSVGANVQEADDAGSRRDFVHKMSIAYTDARESRHWLATIQATILKEDDEVTTLWKEADELIHIIFTIIKNARQSPNRPSQTQ